MAKQRVEKEFSTGNFRKETYFAGSNPIEEFDSHADKKDMLYTVQAISLELIDIDYFKRKGGVLPRVLGERVLSGQMSPAEAITNWEDMVLANENRKLKTTFKKLVMLAEHIKSTGLLHPIHIFPKSEDIGRYQIIEGERRYWAHWLLRKRGFEDYAVIPSVIQDGPSDLIQFSENEDSSPLTTLGITRQAALAYLHKLEIFPEEESFKETSYWSYYKLAAQSVEALTGMKRLPNNFWEDIQRDTGKSRPQILRYLSLLTLSNEALEIADQWNLGINVLISIIEADDNFQNELVELAASYLLPKSDIERLVRLSRLPNKATYRQAVDTIKNPKRDSKKNKVYSRSSSIESSSLKVLESISRLKKVTSGDFTSFARRIIGNVHPDQVSELIADFQSILESLIYEYEQAFKSDSENVNSKTYF
ncbi:MAG: hypothetical protein CL609_15135 [Anaerolineaceae bacterium]|nr:hypothetical protein [Anaerolineaceae bacterium]